MLVGGDGVPEKPHFRMLPCHKKNPDLGDKKVWYASTLLIDQEDAVTFTQGEEVTLDKTRPNLDYFDGLGQRNCPRYQKGWN